MSVRLILLSERAVDDGTLEVIRDGLLFWREHLGRRIAVAFEGGFVLARSLGEGIQVARALRHYRNYLELIFAVKPAPSPTI